MTEERKTCPYCAEDIKVAAIVCKHCGRELPGFEDQNPIDRHKTNQSQEAQKVRRVNWGFGAITGIVFTIISIFSRLPAINAATQVNALVFRPLMVDLIFQSVFVFVIFTLLGLLVNWLWRIDWRIIGGIFAILIAFVIGNFNSTDGLSSREAITTSPVELIPTVFPTSTEPFYYFLGTYNMTCDPVSLYIMSQAEPGERFCTSGILIESPKCGQHIGRKDDNHECVVKIAWNGYMIMAYSRRENCLGCESCDIQGIFKWVNCKPMSSNTLSEGDCVNLSGFAQAYFIVSNGEELGIKYLIIDELGEMSSCS